MKEKAIFFLTSKLSKMPLTTVALRRGFQQESHTGSHWVEPEGSTHCSLISLLCLDGRGLRKLPPVTAPQASCTQPPAWERMGAPQTRDIRPDLNPFACGSGIPLIYTNASSLYMCVCVGGGVLFCFSFLGFVLSLCLCLFFWSGHIPFIL